METTNLSGKKYIFVIVDDYSKYTYVPFLTHKSDVFETFKIFAKKITIKKIIPIMAIKSDRSGEFINEIFMKYYEKKWIKYQILTPSAPQQNGVVEKRNRTLVAMVRTLLND